ncbi:Ras GTPase activating protein ira2 [Malassezia equina]|uniref:Ras GTPase activating protein ira2 n=1 Tax=Malassezia equina TaxID=1381935 RepID=A0AAF0J3P6_9BASI|nr:Ras GTPase activating protein ira2 [Malassezia equina]
MGIGRTDINATDIPWLPSQTCQIALGVLFEYVRHERDAVYDELSLILEDMDMPGFSNLPDTRIHLYRILCVMRLLTSCISYEWKAHLPDENAPESREAWPNPPPLEEGTVRRLMSHILRFSETLLPYEQSIVDAHVGMMGRNSLDSDRARTLNFLHQRDQDATFRERDLYVSMMDACRGLHAGSIHRDNFHVVLPYFPPQRPSMRPKEGGGVFYESACWSTPTESIDTVPVTLAANLSRELMSVMLYLSSSNWETTLQCCGTEMDARLDLRPYEALHWRWPELQRLLLSLSTRLPHMPRHMLCHVSVVIRRILIKWSLWHPEERDQVCANGLPEAATALFDALYALLDSPRRRVVLWPTLCVLSGLSPHIHMPSRTRRDAGTKNAQLLDSIVHSLSNSRTYPVSLFSLALLFESGSLGKKPLSEALIQQFFQRTCDLLPQMSESEPRMPALFLAALVRNRQTQLVAEMMRTAIQMRYCHQLVLMVARTLNLLCSYKLDEPWKQVLFPLCAPLLRRSIRTIVSMWLVRRDMSDLAVSAMETILSLAVADPASLLSSLSHIPSVDPSWSLSLTGQQLDAALQNDSIEGLVLALVRMPPSMLSIHAMAMCALKRLSGGIPPRVLMLRFTYVAPDMLHPLKNPLPISQKVLHMLLPYDKEIVRQNTMYLFEADTQGSQRYWLISTQTSVRRMARANQVSVPSDGPSAVLFGLCSSNRAVVLAAKELGTLLGQHMMLPAPIPALIARLPDPMLLCQTLQAVPAPNPIVRTTWKALFRRWKLLMPRQHTNPALFHELRDITRVLGASMHVALHDVLLSKDEPVLRVVSELLLDPAQHVFVLTLLASIPEAGLPLIIELVYIGSQSDAADTVWLPTLAAVAHRLDQTQVPAATVKIVMEMLLACVRNVHKDEDRCEVCRVAGVLSTFETPEVDVIRFELIDGMLPWALLSVTLRREVVACMVPLTKRLQPVMDSFVKCMDTSAKSAQHRRTARAVDRLLRAGVWKEDTMQALDIVHDSVACQAIKALSQIFEQNPDFLRTEAVSLTGTPLISTRCMVMRAMAEVLNSPPFYAVELESVHANPTMVEILRKDQGRWVASKVMQASTNDVPDWERALSGSLLPHQLFDVLRSLLAMEVQQCQDEHLLMRSNSPALVFLSVYARRSAYVQLQALVRRLVTQADQVPDQALLTEGGGAESASLARHRETAVQLIHVLRESLVSFVMWLPAELHQVFVCLKDAVAARYGKAGATRALHACLCLRVIGPAIAAPSMVGVTPSTSQASHRALMFLNKVLVALPQGGFLSHRDAALTQLNDLVAEASSELHRVVRDTSDRFLADIPDLSVTRTPSLIAVRALHACFGPMAEKGDATAKQLLQHVAPAHSLPERIALIMDGRDRATVYEEFMSTYRESDTSMASNIFYELPTESHAAFCLAYTRMDMVRADLIGLVYYVVRTLSLQMTSWDLVLDMTGATERQMLQSQLTAFIVALLPDAVFRQLSSVYVMNAGAVLLRHSWSFVDAQQQSPFLRRRQQDDGPPMKISWVSKRSEAPGLSDRQINALSPASQRVLYSPATYVRSGIFLDDTLRPPVPAELTVIGDTIVIRSSSESPDPSLPDVHTCDVIPLVDAVLWTDNVSKIAVSRRSCSDELYVHSPDCISIVHDLRCMQMSMNEPSTSVNRIVPLTQVRATFIGMALFYRTSPHMPLRAAADTLLRAAGIVAPSPEGTYTNPLFVMPTIPVSLREGVLRSILDIAGSHGRVNLLSARLDELIISVSMQQQRSMWRQVLSVWMMHPEHRAALRSAFNALPVMPAESVQLFGHACVDLMSSSLSRCAHAIQDAVIVAALPELHLFLVTQVFANITAPPMPNMRHTLCALLALQAVQCLVPNTPLARFLPEVVALFLLFAHEPDELLHKLVYMMLSNTVSCWTGFKSADLDVQDPFHGTKPSVLQLVTYGHKVLHDLAPNADVEHQWRSVLEVRIRSAALTPDGPAQVRALNVLGHISTPSMGHMHSVGSALLAAFPHSPAIVNACAVCLARLFVSDQAAALFWVGLSLVSTGALLGGVRLAHAALRALPPTNNVQTTLLEARHTKDWDSGAMDRVLGVSFDRDFSFACASVLRVPLWDKERCVQQETRSLIERLIKLGAPRTPSVGSPGPMGLALLLYCTDPSDDTRESLQSAAVQESGLSLTPTSMPSSAMGAALAQSLLPRANDLQLQALLPLTIETDRSRDSSSSDSSLRTSDSRPLSQLGFSGLVWKPDSDTVVTECRQWLHDLVRGLAP